MREVSRYFFSFTYVHKNKIVFVLFLERKEPKVQVTIRSFWLDPERTKEVKAHTTEATVSVATLKSRKTRLRLKQPRFFNASLGRPLNASSVRPKQWTIDNGQPKIIFSLSFINGAYLATVEA